MFLILRKFLICDIIEIKKKKTESTLAFKKKKTNHIWNCCKTIFAEILPTYPNTWANV